MKRRNNPAARLCMALAVLFSMQFAACRKEIPEGVLPEDRMVEILYDYHIAKYMGDQLPYGEKYKKVYYLEDVFASNGITEAEFDSSMVWYSRNTDKIVKIYEQVDKRLDEEIEGVKKQLAQHDNKLLNLRSGDSTSIWNGRMLYLLSSTPSGALLKFDQNVDTTFHKGDSVLWTARLFFASPADSCRKAVASLTVNYKNDSTATHTAVYAVSDTLDIRAVTDSVQELNSLMFSIYLESSDREGRDKVAVEGMDIVRRR